ncbi:MAG TPA: BREX system P-loop protein BrxC [Azospirillum sp.]|nr:BREX system P-loop protein BrxC [Azospirillum sp.]
MKLKDVLLRDPGQTRLANNGQARLVDDRDTEKAMLELREELKSFVCEGQYADGMIKILRAFLNGGTSLPGAWVSGFYGSGKSHLLKMLCHLWQNTAFPDGATARALVPSLPDEVKELLKELDTQGKRAGGLLAAAGAMPNGGTDAVRLTILSVILRAVGLPEQYAPARFCLWLEEQGKLDHVRDAVKAAGKDFNAELNSLYVSPLIANALMSAIPDLATSPGQVRLLLREQFPQKLSDITTTEFLDAARAALKLRGHDGQIPLTLLVLDEVQQYIGTVHDRSVLVSEVAEAVSKQMNGRVMIVGAGQSALSSAPHLQRLMDRFTVRVPLSDIDVETVTRKVLLQKKPAALGDVRSTLDTHAGEVSRQLSGTRIQEGPEDRAVIVDDYPILPVRRRFFEECFRQLDAGGTQSQLRSQLRIVHDALHKRAERNLGTLIPADELYEALAPELVNTGILLREINERILQVRKDVGDLAARICGVVFLINRLKREAGMDTGIRSTKEHIADLLVDDLTADNGKLRADVDETLKRLVDRGDLMPVDEEYRLQTREGAEWDREFRAQQNRAAADTSTVYFRREQLIGAEFESAIKGVQLLQGDAKEPRKLAVHRGDTAPPADTSVIQIWMRDGWTSTEKQVQDAARAAGNESPTIFVFIPRAHPDALRDNIRDMIAAKATLDTKGIPSTKEGEEAKLSMDSRLSIATKAVQSLVKEIVGQTKVYQGGGNDVMRLTVADQIEAAAEDSLVRLFPRFKEADSGHWETVFKRAREGADNPFQVVGHAGALETHPVCQQVLTTIGAGRSGSDIRKELQAPPLGWPKEAIDAALVALHSAGVVTAVANGEVIAPKHLDHNRIPKADFRKEGFTLSATQKLALRKLYQALGVPNSAEQLAANAPEFLSKLKGLGAEAGGQAPLPASPDTKDIADIEHLAGNERLSAIHAKAEDFTAKIETWTALKDLKDKRLPAWTVLDRLSGHARGLDSATDPLEQAETIRDKRLLLDGTDHVTPVRAALASLLREEVGKLHAEHLKAHQAAETELAGNALWGRLAADRQASILTDVGLTAPAEPNLSSDETLLQHLDRKPLPTARTEIDAIAGRVQRALEKAAKLLEPKVRMVTLERATLNTPEEVEAWLAKARATLTDALGDGPVMVS